MDKLKYNFIECNDRIAFHPGYYIKEFLDEGICAQEDLAQKLGMSSHELNLLIGGKQNLSTDVAIKLSRMLNTSVKYWINLQSAYDDLLAQFELDGKR